MSVVLCLPAHLRVSTAASRGQAPHGNASREEECFQELKKKIASSNCLGVPRPKGEIVLITDASDVGGGVVRSTNGRSLTPLN